jgi:GT2 family glycosyltransferase
LDALLDAHREDFVDAVVVDNASDDGTADFVAETYPWVRLVRNAKNVGFGRGCNRGFEHVIAPYVLILNPDAVMEYCALKILVAYMEGNERIGICGPAVTEQSGALQPAGSLPSPWKTILKPLFAKWTRGIQRHIVPGEHPAKTNWLCGSILLIRRSVLDTIGGFDPRFFLYFEETDLCYRALKAGWEIWTVGTAVGKHVNGASAKKMNTPMMWGAISEHYFQSRYYYMMKHYGSIWAKSVEVGELVCMACRAAVECVRGKTYPDLALRLRAPIFKVPPRM